jgi:hypothetical protein
MGSNYSEDRGQAQVRAFPRRLGGKEWFKDLVENLCIRPHFILGQA